MANHEVQEAIVHMKRPHQVHKTNPLQEHRLIHYACYTEGKQSGKKIKEN